MGWKNEMLDKKERLRVAVESEDYETINEVVDGWRSEGWRHHEIAKKFEEWCDLDMAEFDALMEECDDWIGEL